MSFLSVEMADADDSQSWYESATRHAVLVAHQIARLRNPWWNPAWRDLVADDPPPARSFAFRWGSRGRRSRTPAVARDVRLAKGDAAAACSPATPFDFGSGSGSGSRSGYGSGASTSGGEEGSSWQAAAAAAAAAGKRRRVRDDADVSGAGGGCETKVVGIGASAAKDVRRAGKRKTLCELREEEKFLLQERNMLQKEMEVRKKAYESLRSENQRLKGQQIRFRSERAPIKFATARASPPAPIARAPFVLPDLNEPPSENLDSTC